LIETRTTAFGPAETAAHSLMVNDRGSSFFEELGIELAPVQPESKARYIYRKGKMRRFPLTFLETLHTLRSFFSKPAHPINPASASLADWARTYIGEPVLRNLLAPFVTGVYAATPEELLLSTAFPSLVPIDPRRSLFWNVLAARKKPGREKNRPKMMAPKDGMESVIQKLKDLIGPDLYLNHPIHELPDVPNLVVCVPPTDLAGLIEKSDPDSANALRAVRASPLVTITAFARSVDFQNGPPRGVGVLIPRNEGLRILGVLFNSSSFPGRAHEPETVSMTVMLGGTTDPDAVNLDDEQITGLITRELGSLLGFQGTLLHREITRWPWAIPVYSQLLQDARLLLSKGFFSRPGRVLFTNYSKDVSIRGMIDSLRLFS
jgi:oxygen-dependent protoporphyrinogen oxidase